jgi:hypothetical protein
MNWGLKIRSRSFFILIDLSRDLVTADDIKSSVT